MQAGIENDLIRGGGLDQTQFSIDGLALVDNRVNEPLIVLPLSTIKEMNIIKGGLMQNMEMFVRVLSMSLQKRAMPTTTDR